MYAISLHVLLGTQAQGHKRNKRSANKLHPVLCCAVRAKHARSTQEARKKVLRRFQEGFKKVSRRAIHSFAKCFIEIVFCSACCKRSKYCFLNQVLNH